MIRQTNPNFMAGVPELLILRLLHGRAMYGYEIVQEIRSSTGDAITAGEGAIYPILHTLERDGALKSERKMVAGRNRVYYVLTATGQQRFVDLKRDWTNLNAAIRTVLDGGSHVSAV